jgi:VWFA-related protein
MRGAGVVLAAWLAWNPFGFAQSFKSGTQGIRVDVLVTDRGKPVSGLTTNDFELFDNGVPQTIALADFDQLPLDIVLAFDMSASVTPRRLGHLRRAAGALLDLLSPRDRAGLVTFSHAVVRRQGLTPDPSQLRAALGAADPAGATSLVDGVYAGMMLGENTAGRALLIVFSDGVDTASWLTAESVLQTARRSDVVAYGVAVGSQEPEFLRSLAEATGGKLFENESEQDLDKLFVSVLNEFRQRYVLMYTPTSAEAGWHRLEVRLKGRRQGSVKARPGYLADPPGLR